MRAVITFPPSSTSPITTLASTTLGKRADLGRDHWPFQVNHGRASAELAPSSTRAEFGTRIQTDRRNFNEQLVSVDIKDQSDDERVRRCPV